MKTIKKNVSLLALSTLLILSSIGFAQRGHGNSGGNHHGGNRSTHGNRHTKVIVKHPHHNAVVYKHPHGVRRSAYRPAVIKVYNPHWCPHRNYNRRWVYFPRYNFYWDNWRQIYVYRNANVWVTNPTPPPTIVNVNIENEKSYELKEDDDDTDDIYISNDNHTTEYKAEN